MPDPQGITWDDQPQGITWDDERPQPEGPPRAQDIPGQPAYVAKQRLATSRGLEQIGNTSTSADTLGGSLRAAGQFVGPEGPLAQRSPTYESMYRAGQAGLDATTNTISGVGRVARRLYQDPSLAVRPRGLLDAAQEEIPEPVTSAMTTVGAGFKPLTAPVGAIVRNAATAAGADPETAETAADIGEMASMIPMAKVAPGLFGLHEEAPGRYVRPTGGLEGTEGPLDASGIKWDPPPERPAAPAPAPLQAVSREPIGPVKGLPAEAAAVRNQADEAAMQRLNIPSEEEAAIQRLSIPPREGDIKWDEPPAVESPRTAPAPAIPAARPAATLGGADQFGFPTEPDFARGQSIVRENTERLATEREAEIRARLQPPTIQPNRGEMKLIQDAIKANGAVSEADVPPTLEEKIVARKHLADLAQQLQTDRGLVGRTRTLSANSTDVEWQGVKSSLPKELQQGRSYDDITALIRKGLAGESLTEKQAAYFGDLQKWARKTDGPLTEAGLVDFLAERGLPSATAEMHAADAIASGERAGIASETGDDSFGFGTNTSSPPAETDWAGRIAANTRRLEEIGPQGQAGDFREVNRLKDENRFFQQRLNHEQGQSIGTPAERLKSDVAGRTPNVEKINAEPPSDRQRQVVKNALDAGIAVPKELLDRYPDLRKSVEEFSHEASEQQRAIEERDAAAGRKIQAGPKAVQGSLGLSEDRGQKFDQRELGLEPQTFPAKRDTFQPPSSEDVAPVGGSIEHVEQAPGTKQQIHLQRDIFREQGAMYSMKRQRLSSQLTDIRNSFDRLPGKQREAAYLDFVRRREAGQAQPTPALQSAADTLTRILEDGRRDVQATGSGALDEFIRNYHPHMYDDPEAAGKFLASWVGKRPLEGSKGFLKHRVFPTLDEAVAAGLRPKFDNPVDDVLAKRAEMDRFVLGQNAVLEGLKLGTVAETPKDGPPRGWRQLPSVKGGKYMALDPVAKEFSKYLDPGLQDNPLYKGYMGAARAMTQAKLSLSAFHATTTALNSMMSTTALGVRQLSISGQRLEGLGNIVRGALPTEPFIQAWRGMKIMRDAIKGGDSAGLIEKGGGRLAPDTIYMNNRIEAFTRAVRRGEGLKMVQRAPAAALEALSTPIMKWQVPFSKLAAFQDMAESEMARLGPEASQAEIRNALGKAWDSVDNRFGELVYDNLFWHKIYKDIPSASMLSMGWNLGTARELGGAVKDLGLTSQRMAGQTGAGFKDAAISNRMAYGVTLPAIAALYGATYHYLSGNGAPKSTDDYFHPRGPDGVRRDLPTYMREVFGDAARLGLSKGGEFRPLDIAWAKANPFLKLVTEELRNKDWSDHDIADRRADAMKQLRQRAEYAAGQSLPISIGQYQKGQGAESFAGITKTPKYVLHPGPPENYRYNPSKKYVQKPAAPRTR